MNPTPAGRYFQKCDARLDLDRAVKYSCTHRITDGAHDMAEKTYPLNLTKEQIEVIHNILQNKADAKYTVRATESEKEYARFLWDTAASIKKQAIGGR